MLRVVVYINFTPVIDTHCVRTSPYDPKQGTLCTYETSYGTLLKERFDTKNGARKLAIKLLKAGKR